MKVLKSVHPSEPYVMPDFPKMKAFEEQKPFDFQKGVKDRNEYQINPKVAAYLAESVSKFDEDCDLFKFKP